MAPRRRRKPRSLKFVFPITVILLIITMINVMLIHHHMPTKSSGRHPAGFPFSVMSKKMILRREHGSHKEVIARIQSLLQARWDLQHPREPSILQSSTIGNPEANNTQRMNSNSTEDENVETMLPQNSADQKDESLSIIPPNLGLLLEGNMSIALLDALKHFNASAVDEGSKCSIPSDNGGACTEMEYTVLAVVVSAEPNFRRICLNILKWLHSPSVAEVRLVLTETAAARLRKDPIYGARIQAWHRRRIVRFSAVDPKKNIWEAVSEAPITTRAVVWWNGEESLISRAGRAKPDLLSTGMAKWKEMPNELVAPSFPVRNLTLPHWNGLFHDRDWLCLVRTEPFRSLSWRDWEHALHGMVLFLGHVPGMGATYYAPGKRVSSVLLEEAATVFGGFPVDASGWPVPRLQTCR